MNFAYDYSGILQKHPLLFQCKFNNIGPVDKETNYISHTKGTERYVISFMSDMLRLPHDNVWGYITANGTESNTQALYMARQIHSDGILYISADTHYSIPKIAKMLRIPLVVVKSTSNGEMNYLHFENELRKRLHAPAIVCANLGTTMKGAIDDTKEIFRILQKHGMESRYYLHADGALMGFVLPLMQDADFSERHIHSISISCHKFLGVPFPCGFILMDKKLCNEALQKSPFVEIVDSNDVTISGSRSGHAALFIQYAFEKYGMDGFRKDVAVCKDNAGYAVSAINKLGLGHEAWKNNLSITIVLRKPADWVVKKWQLACVENLCHIVVLPHVTKELLDEFVDDLKISAFP